MKYRYTNRAEKGSAKSTGTIPYQFFFISDWYPAVDVSVPVEASGDQLLLPLNPPPPKTSWTLFLKL